MKIFHCDYCGELIYFENFQCLNCDHPLGYCSDVKLLCTFKILDNGLWESLAKSNKGKLYKPCTHYIRENVCNWMIEADREDHFCMSCDFNEVIPDLNIGDNLKYWYRIEKAKRRVIYNIQSLKLPLKNKKTNLYHGLAFKFLEGPDLNKREQNPVVTGHNQGLVTINLDEANDAIRVKMREEMRERYRTIIGHFRHEIGHYYWFLLIDNSPWLDKFRAIFGDERENYNIALERYYANRPLNDNLDPNYISTYASAHPWEDWAETWAHYMHMYDTLETANTWGIQHDNQDWNYDSSFNSMMDTWIWTTGALNSLNRSMGLNDPYPFIITSQVKEKLNFIHNIIHDHNKFESQNVYAKLSSSS